MIIFIIAEYAEYGIVIFFMRHDTPPSPRFP